MEPPYERAMEEVTILENTPDRLAVEDRPWVLGIGAIMVDIFGWLAAALTLLAFSSDPCRR